MSAYIADRSDEEIAEFIQGRINLDDELYGDIGFVDSEDSFADWLFESMADDASGSAWADENGEPSKEEYSNCDRLLMAEAAQLAPKFFPRFRHLIA